MCCQQCMKLEQLIEFIEENCKGIPKGVIFDCDGVLVDSVEANMAFYNAIRKKIRFAGIECGTKGILPNEHGCPSP